MDHLSSELKGIPGLEARVHQLNADDRAAQAKLADLKRQMFETDQAIKTIRSEKAHARAELSVLRGVSDDATDEMKYSDGVVDEVLSYPSDGSLLKLRERAKSAGLGSRHCQRLSDFVFKVESGKMFGPAPNGSSAFQSGLSEEEAAAFKFRLISTIRDCIVKYKAFEEDE
jgi:hypothetical protein